MEKIDALRLMLSITTCLDREVGRDRDLIVSVSTNTFKTYKLSGLQPLGVFSRCKGINENIFVEDDQIRVVFTDDGSEKWIYFVSGIAAMKAAVSAGITKAKD